MQRKMGKWLKKQYPSLENLPYRTLTLTSNPSSSPQPELIASLLALVPFLMLSV